MTDSLVVLHLLGSLTGAVGVSVAIYLQFITRRACPPGYVAMFFAFGASIITLNASTIVVIPDIVAAAVRLVAYAVIVSIELIAAHWVYEQLDVPPPTQAVVNRLTDLEGDDRQL